MIIVAIAVIILILALKVQTYSSSIRNILLIGLLLRVFVYAADINHWFHIFGSGVDSEAFNYYAKQIATTGHGFELTHYTTFLSVIYTLTDCSREFAQAINLIFGMGVLFIAVKTFIILNIPEKNQKKALWILAVLPILVNFSGILLREAWIEFFVALSVLEFTKWYTTGRKWHMISTCLYVCCGIYMHDGVIALLTGYIVSFAVYSPKQRVIHISMSHILVIVLILVGFAAFSDIFMGEKSAEFTRGDSASLIVEYSNMDATGNSGYLNWLPKTTNPIVGLLFAPLKMLYFMFAPLPTEWRRVYDIMGFLIDSCFYLTMWYCIYKYYPSPWLQNYKRCLLIGILTATFMFSYGTLNAGTAFRHRAKFCEPIAVLFAISGYREKESESVPL